MKVNTTVSLLLLSTIEFNGITVDWNNKGDFGPNTPNTKTDGIQEALDECVKKSEDLYIKGGFGALKAVYHIKETIHIPAAQDFKIDGGIYVLNWEGEDNKPLLRIDSAMNCDYKFGIMVYGGTKQAILIKPENPVPVDKFAVFVENRIDCQGASDPNPFLVGKRKTGIGILLDGTKAKILCNDFIFFGVLNFETCMETRGSVENNDIKVLHLHTAAHNSTLFRSQSGFLQNNINTVIATDGAHDVKGFEIEGRRNTFNIRLRNPGQQFNPLFHSEDKSNVANILGSYNQK